MHTNSFKIGENTIALSFMYLEDISQANPTTIVKTNSNISLFGDVVHKTAPNLQILFFFPHCIIISPIPCRSVPYLGRHAVSLGPALSCQLKIQDNRTKTQKEKEKHLHEIYQRQNEQVKQNTLNKGRTVIPENKLQASFLKLCILSSVAGKS